ncbi:MAG: sulfotransferase family 2 domain-containing protein [Desulfosalsimonadaceae bacterium]
MIISHKYKFIFIKTNKTAGTSVEIALARFCGKDDIITPNDPKDEEIRKQLNYPGPQNWEAPFTAYRFRDIFRMIQRQKKKARFYHHMSAAEIRSLLDESVWKNYYKFCFERNPWDRMISFYYWRHKSGPRPPMSEFIDSNDPELLHKYGYRLYTINDEVVVDRLCRFENLESELAEVGRKLGFPENPLLPRAKTYFRKDRRHYRDILTPEDRGKIARLFEREIRLMKYQFDPS